MSGKYFTKNLYFANNGRISTIKTEGLFSLNSMLSFLIKGLLGFPYYPNYVWNGPSNWYGVIFISDCMATNPLELNIIC